MLYRKRAPNDLIDPSIERETNGHGNGTITINARRALSSSRKSVGE